MITSAESYTKKQNKTKEKNGQTEPQHKCQKQSYTDKITERSIHIHTHKEKNGKIYIYIKGRE